MSELSTHERQTPQAGERAPAAATSSSTSRQSVVPLPVRTSDAGVPSAPREAAPMARLRRSTDQSAAKRPLDIPALPQVASGGSTPLPDNLRSAAEAASGQSLDSVRVHRGSPEPAQLGARAFTRGDEIHLGPGAEDTLGHEAWHAVQQRSGRVGSAGAGTSVNADPALEREADEAGRSLVSGSSIDHDPRPEAASAEGIPDLFQLVKAELQLGPTAPTVMDVTWVRQVLATARQQIDEYTPGYPAEVVTNDSRAEMNQLHGAALTDLATLVAIDNWGGGTVIGPASLSAVAGTAALQRPAMRRLSTALKDLKSSVDAHYFAWEGWHALNPETVDELESPKAGGAFFLENKDHLTFGKYAERVFISANRGVPQLPTEAQGDDVTAYESSLVQDRQIDELQEAVGEMDLTRPAGAVRGELARSQSAGAVAMRAELRKTDQMTFTRVMSAGEAEGVRAAGGIMLRKGAGAKWITIGTDANIHSSGDDAHNHTVVWKVRADLRKVLLRNDSNYYNENSVNRDEYVEPYWVWKDAEDANIAFSPVFVSVFNDMIVSTTIDGEAV